MSVFDVSVFGVSVYIFDVSVFDVSVSDAGCTRRDLSEASISASIHPAEHANVHCERSVSVEASA